MGLFSKIKDILFEDEGEEASTDSMPVFTKEDSVANKDSEKETISFDDDEDEPLRVTTGSRFRNDKRDLDLDDTDLFSDEDKSEKKDVEEENIELPMAKMEDSSPILPFDEDEFDRLNARVNREIEKAQEKSVRETYQERENLLNNVDARKANNNFSSTDAPRERYDNNDKGEKKFTPSPVISPVYGILDKNYKKDDIVDRVGGLKREKKVKPKTELPKEVEEVKVEIKKEEKVEELPILKEEIVHEEPIRVDLDSVRKKAFGSIDNLLEEALEEVNNSNGEKTKIEPEPVEVEEVTPVVVEPEVKEAVIEEEKIEEPILDRVEEKEEVKEEIHDDSDKMIEDLLDEGEKKDKEDVSELILKDIDEEEERKEKELDDLEKTSTLKILDDIEKELNDVEPISKKENLDNTLESDLFNLIDSMYEKGEDE